jgi:hypothetical protein
MGIFYLLKFYELVGTAGNYYESVNEWALLNTYLVDRFTSHYIG